MTVALFIVGVPGVGKTTLARALLGTSPRLEGRWTVGRKYAALGDYTAFGTGADGIQAIPVRQAEYRRAPEGRHAVFEGLSFPASEMRLAQLRRPLVVVHLRAPLVVVRERRAKRGSAPMPTDWYQRHETRVAGFLDVARVEHAHLVTIDARRTVDELARAIACNMQVPAGMRA